MKKTIPVFMALILTLTSCKANSGNNAEVPGTDIAEKNVTETVATPVPDPVKEILDGMTLDEKIGQLFIVSLNQDEQGNAILAVNDSIKSIMKKYKPGGIMLFAENIKTITQTSALIQDMQEESRIPLFVAVDEEGGLVSRITKSSEMHATVFPNNAVIGKQGDPALAEQVAKAIASEISSLGFNMNFAPVADVNTNPNNTVIGVRAYGSNADLVGKMVSAAVTGIQTKPVSAVLKHFPGHGDTENDSHYGTAVVNHTKERLLNTELLPFIEGINAGADAVMTAHILTPEIPGDNLPATLKPEILTGILRNELRFGGLIITDALNMGAITNHYTSAEAAVKAIFAGADVLLMPKDLEAAFSGIKKAHQDGVISTERINESVRRITETKHKRGLFGANIDTGDPEKILGCREHRDLLKMISK